VLREGPAIGVRVAIATQRLTPAINPVANLCDARLLLRMSNRQDHVMAGGSSDSFVANANPGRGWWRGHPVQVAFCDSTPRPAAAVAASDFPPGTVAVVSAAPREFAERSRRMGVTVVELTPGSANPTDLVVSTGSMHLIGDPDAWQAHWGAVSALAATTPVVFDRCSLADYRALTKSRAVPPPIVGSREVGILLVEGRVERVSLTRGFRS